MTVLKWLGVILCLGVAFVLFVFWALFMHWSTRYAVSAPDGSSRIEVKQLCSIADCAVRVVASQGWASDEIRQGSDCVINFAHAGWFDPVVAIFVDGGYCSSIRVAYDLRARKKVRFEDYESLLSQDIVRAYQVTPDELRESNGNVLEWATYPGDGESHRAMSEFRRRFPPPLF